MPTGVVSGRVDLDTKDRAERYIKAAGMTPADVIKTVWERIAQTGEVPTPDNDAADAAAYDEFMAFRDELPPAEPWLADLTDDQLHDLIASHYA